MNDDDKIFIHQSVLKRAMQMAVHNPRTMELVFQVARRMNTDNKAEVSQFDLCSAVQLQPDALDDLIDKVVAEGWFTVDRAEDGYQFDVNPLFVQLTA